MHPQRNKSGVEHGHQISWTGRVSRDARNRKEELTEKERLEQQRAWFSRKNSEDCFLFSRTSDAHLTRGSEGVKETKSLEEVRPEVCWRRPQGKPHEHGSKCRESPHPFMHNTIFNSQVLWLTSVFLAL